MANEEVEIRQLNDDEESKWLDMVAVCYAIKGTPRGVFENHLQRTSRNERILLAAVDNGK